MLKKKIAYCYQLCLDILDGFSVYSKANLIYILNKAIFQYIQSYIYMAFQYISQMFLKSQQGNIKLIYQTELREEASENFYSDATTQKGNTI